MTNGPHISSKVRSLMMTTRVKLLLVALCVMAFSFASSAQTPERRQTSPRAAPQEQSPTPSPIASADAVANEIGLLRQSLQTLTARLRQISEKLFAPDAKQGDSLDARQNRINVSLDLLTRAEQRAESMRRQLFDLIEKETAYKGRLVQIEEEMRPESIERASSLVGSTRTAELREVRRRVLDNERKGFEALLKKTTEGRVQLETDLIRADAMVSRLRQRVLPLIEREIERINPAQ
jgi:exonuclease VII large subunit